MCGRFIIQSNKPFGIDFKKSFNIKPSNLIPIKTNDGVKLIKWSFSPSWIEGMNLINCRSETMNEKPLFRKLKRCIVFNNGWYEWRKKKSEKIPYFIFSKSSFFAGLFNDNGCLILTRNAVNKILHIHHRQPVLLEDSELDKYLKGENLFNSYANNNLGFHQVSKKVNNPLNDGPELIHKI
tara:strand:- start:827 stop:1369 length:543 start_codon:yes stop_codon:yes gene_type:complete